MGQANEKMDRARGETHDLFKGQVIATVDALRQELKSTVDAMHGAIDEVIEESAGAFERQNNIIAESFKNFTKRNVDAYSVLRDEVGLLRNGVLLMAGEMKRINKNLATIQQNMMVFDEHLGDVHEEVTTRRSGASTTTSDSEASDEQEDESGASAQPTTRRHRQRTASSDNTVAFGEAMTPRTRDRFRASVQTLTQPDPDLDIAKMVTPRKDEREVSLDVPFHGTGSMNDVGSARASRARSQGGRTPRSGSMIVRRPVRKNGG